MSETQRETRQAVSELREEVRPAGTQLKEKAREATARIKEESVELATQQKETVASSLEHFGAPLRRAANQLYEDQEQGIATVTEKLANQIDAATNAS